MNKKEIKKLVDLIDRSFKKMEEFIFFTSPVSPIYGFMLRSLVTPRGTKITIKGGINVSRQIKDSSRYFRIDYNKRRPLLLPANTPSEIEAAIIWMENNHCLPRIEAFKTLIIKVHTIKV